MDKKAIVISQFKFDADPRHGYWSKSLRDRGYEVTEIELLQLPESGLDPVQLSQRANRISVFHWSDHTQFLQVSPSEYRELCLAPYETAIGKYLEKILTSITLSLQLVRERLGEVDVLVANDLIPAAACVLSGLSSNCSIYDAQEFFTSSYDVLGIRGLSDREKAVWDRRESVVAGKFSKRISISLEGCQIMKERTGFGFEEIPNCIPMARVNEAHKVPSKFETAPTQRGPVRYVFLGRAEPNRGLEQLIDAWNFSPEIATLSLFVPESAHKQKLLRRSRKQRKSTSVLFPSPIPNSQVISGLSTYDIGIVPYLYQGEYAYATPTKFGEYVAAGLPILVSNACKTVVRLVKTHAIGVATDFQDSRLIHQSVREMNVKIGSDVLAAKVSEFRRQYVWERYFNEVFDSVLVSQNSPDNLTETPDRRPQVAMSVKGTVATDGSDMRSGMSTLKRVRAVVSVLQLALALRLVRRLTFVARIASNL